MAINVIGGSGSGSSGDLGSTIVAAFQVPVAGAGRLPVSGGLAAGNYVIEWRGQATNSAAIYGYVGTTPALLASSLITYSNGGSVGSVGLNNYVFTTTQAFDGLYITGFSGAVIVRRWTAAVPATLTINNWANFGGAFGNITIIGPYGVAALGSTVIAVQYSSGPFMQVSTDAGSTWSNTAASVSFLGNIGAGNGLFVAAPWGSASNSVTTSPNGTTWTSRTLTASRLWQGNPHWAGSLSTPRWIVTGPDGSANISTDGVTWTAATIVAGTNSNPYFIGSGGGLAIALRSGDSTYYTSTDLSTWTARTFPTTVGSVPYITYGNGRFVVSNLSTTVYYTSVDGINWVSNTTPATGTAAVPITLTNGVFCYGMVNNVPVSSSSTFMSTNLVNWFQRNWTSNTTWAGFIAGSTSHFHFMPNNGGNSTAARTAASLDTLI
jgi:hypothetical protein